MTVRHDGPLELSRFLPYRISVLANTVSRALSARYVEEFGLPVPQWRVMAVLGREPGLSANEVAARTAMDKVGVSRAVAGLVRDGRARQDRDPADARRTRLRLTPAGRAIYRRIVPRAHRFEAALLADLGRDELAGLMGGLERLQRAADRLITEHGGPG